MDQGTQEKLYRLLRSHRPHSLVAVDVEGNKRPVSLKPGKGRWDGAVATLVSMSEELERVEFLDGDGAVSRVWRMPEPLLREPVDAPEPVSAPLGPDVPMLPWPLVERLLRLQAEAADAAVRQHMAATSQGHEKLVQTLQLVTEANTHLMDMQQATLQTAYEATLARGEAAAQLAAQAAQGGAEGNPMEALLMGLVASKLGIPPAALASMAGNGAADPEKH